MMLVAYFAAISPSGDRLDAAATNSLLPFADD